MKKLLLFLLFVPFSIFGANPIVIPSSSLPVYTDFQPWYRFLMLDTNNAPSTNGTMQFTTLSNLFNVGNAKGADVTNYTTGISNILANLSGGFQVLITNGSSAATIQDTFNNTLSNNVVSIQPGIYQISTNIYLTNSMTILGNGSVFKATNNLVGFMIDMTTNGYNNTVVIDNLRFDGGIYVTYNDVSRHLSVGSSSWEPYYNAAWTNHSGLRVDASGGVRIQNCTFSGWSGNGCLAIQKGGSFTSQTTPKFEFLFNRCFTNFIGVFATSAEYEVPGYYNSDPSLWRAGYGAEYSLIEGNDCFQNQFGICASAGNALIQGNSVNANYFGIAGFSGDNSQHGRWTGNTLNHNVIVVYSESSGLFNSSMVQDNVMLADQEIVFNSAQGVIFKNNWIGKPAITFTNGCTGIFGYNVYDFGAVWGGTSPSTQIITNIDPRVIIVGNLSQDGTNTDGTLLSQMNLNNNFGMTVLTNVWPPTYKSLGASSTNMTWQAPSNSVPPNWWFGHFDASSNVVFDGHMP